MIDPLPDFIQLSPEDLAREKERQEKLRRDFNTRARQTGPELEASRAFVLEDSLRDSFDKQTDPHEKEIAANRLAENISLQGRFIEAAQLATDPVAIEFYKKAADAITNPRDCTCEPQITIADGKRIKLPKYHDIKEIYSIPDHKFMFLRECGTCHNWTIASNGVHLVRLTPKDLADSPPNDLERLKA